MNKSDLVAALEDMATLLELNGENVFKVRAFQNGARVVEQFPGDVVAAVKDGSLRNEKGIGAGLFTDLKTLVETGSLPVLEDLRAKTPAGLYEILALPGVGAKKVKAIYEGLGVTNLGELEYAITENRLVDLPGFGAKSQAKIADAIRFVKAHAERRLYPEALANALPVLEALRAHPAAIKVELAGSLRRGLETVKDIDLVAATNDPKALGDAFVALPMIESVEGRGEEKITVVLQGGQKADLRMVSEAEFDSCLLHFTGSKPFNLRLRQLAKAKGLKLNEYGLFDGDKRLECDSEGGILAALGLAWVPPERREDIGEVEQALKGPLPEAVKLEDLQGVFHVHSVYSDGENTIRELAEAARAKGWKYIGISDHSVSAFYARGLTVERLAEQRAEIAALNAEYAGEFTILHGIESDILADGRLDYDEETLGRFDFVIGSIHSRLGQDAETTTRRLVTALSNPHLTMLGHLTGRLLLSRDAVACDWDAVYDAAAEHGKIIELNANPHRLDVDWRELPKLMARGIKISINPDAHRVSGLDDVAYGVMMARKAGLSHEQVANTHPNIY